jgi:hypothetical protein
LEFSGTWWFKKKGFWSALMEFRKAIEKEGIQITDAYFRRLRDTSFGRESELYG